VLTLSAFVNLSPASGFTYSTVTAISEFFAFILIEFVRRQIIGRAPNMKQMANLAFILTVGLITGGFSALTLHLFNGTGSFFLSLLFAPYLSALVLIGSTIKLALSDRREILENLSKGARRLTMSSSDSLQSSQAASYLHNSLQSELTALAHEFELVAENPDKEKSKAVLEKLESLIRRSMGEDFANFLESPEIRLDRVLASWNGIVTLKTSIDRALFSDPARGNLFVQLVEESLGNSVRKGQATQVKITATFIGSRLEIEIFDNGHFDKTSKPGLGSAWIERYAVGESKFDATESGTRLTVEL
jgi:signal transduction histidine kinase